MATSKHMVSETSSPCYWLPAVAVLLLLLVATVLVPNAKEEVAFLDVAQGDSILLQEGTRQVLIDGGPGQHVLQRVAEEMPWFDRTIEVVVATHPDKDHLEGLLAILRRYDVELVLVSYVPHTSQLQEAWVNELGKAARERGTQFRFVWAGESMTAGEMKFSFLWPTVVWAQNHPTPTNNNSIVTRVDVEGKSFLLSADAEEVVEKQLVGGWQHDLLDVDVLKAGHHGSKTSTSAEFLAAASPGVVAISVGEDNTYGHPHPDVLGRLTSLAVARTDLAGTIRFLRVGEAWFLDCAEDPCLSEQQ